MTESLADKPVNTGSAVNAHGGRLRRFFIAISLAPLTFLLFGCGVNNDEMNRQEQVRAAGETVMPFDLDSTSHHFVIDPSGGVQTVLADDPRDLEQVGLVREHLIEISEKFTHGDFSDPSSIHGVEMPGLETLSSNTGKIEVTYSEIEGGGKITYRSQDPVVVEAIQVWFNAQLSDHGSDATANNPDAGGLTFEELHQLHHPKSVSP